VYALAISPHNIVTSICRREDYNFPIENEVTYQIFEVINEIVSSHDNISRKMGPSNV